MPTPHPEAEALIQSLGLGRLEPEGGWYRRVWPREPEERDAPRAESSAIHYLLTRGDMSALHRLDAPETWFHMAGGPVRLMVIGEGGRLTRHRLIPGRSVIVPAGCWQAAELGTAQWALMALTMRPGFHWRGFELADRAKLTHRWPRHAQLLEQVCAAEHAERPG